jgi:gamma-D-glutamyl-L-lysine dipeptidyl-peptidase
LLNSVYYTWLCGFLFNQFMSAGCTGVVTDLRRKFEWHNPHYLVILKKILLMEYYICENVFVPLRSGPSHKAEMTSQILFGEKYTVVDKSGSWIKIEINFDKYQGWIDTDHIQDSRDEGFSCGYVLNRALACYKDDKTKMVLEAGSEVYNPDFEEKTFVVGKNVYTAVSEFNNKFIATNDSLPETAMKFLNSPYMWGGRITSGIDCSGLTQLVYKIHGFKLPRDSFQQAETGRNIDFINEAEPGDLVFFDNERGRIAHVGMIISSGLVIHSSGRVRMDSIDHQGIYKPETGRYSHRLRLIRRIV